MREARARLRRARRRRVAVLTVAFALVLSAAGGGVALAAGRAGGERYRTAVAALGSVAQSVDVVGTVASAERRDAAFSVAGTVASVEVAVGDVVAAGDVLATLDPEPLQAAVDEAATALAEAQQQLSDDLASQTAGASTTSASTASSSTTSSAGTTSPGLASAGSGASSGSVALVAARTPVAAPTATPSGTGGSDAVADARRAVEAAQQELADRYDAATGALAASDDRVGAATAACQAFLAVAAPDDATGGLLTLSPGTVAAGAALVVSGAGLPAGEVDLRLASTGAVLATVTVGEDGSLRTAVAVPSGAAGSDAIEAVAAGTTLGSTPLTVTSGSGLAGALGDCQDAIGGALDAQASTGDAQQALLDAAGALDDAVAALQAAVDAAGIGSGGTGSGGTGTGGTGTGGSGQQPGASGEPSAAPSSAPGSGTGTDAGGQPGSGTPSGGATAGGTGPSSGQGSGQGTGQGGSTTPASAAQVLADRAAIALAEANLDLAQRRAQLDTLTAPVGGTVAAVGLAAGDAVTASSSTQVVTVLAPDGYVVTATVGLADVDAVEVGQSATVRVRTQGDTLTATVSRVGLLDVSDSSTPSYDVELALQRTDAVLYDGSSAQVAIAVAGADDVLTVPSSAVHVDGGTTSVLRPSGDTTRSVEVTTGAVGTERTEITSGLTAGDEVVLADLTTDALPSSGSSGSSGLSGLSGGAGTTGRQAGDFPGSGLPGAGAGGRPNG